MNPFGVGGTSALYIRDVSYDWNGREWLAELDAPAEWPRRIRPLAAPTMRSTGCAHHGRDVGVPCDVCGKVRER